MEVIQETDDVGVVKSLEDGDLQSDELHDSGLSSQDFSLEGLESDPLGSDNVERGEDFAVVSLADLSLYPVSFVYDGVWFVHY